MNSDQGAPMPELDLAEIRSRIDRIDTQITDLFLQRMEAAAELFG